MGLQLSSCNNRLNMLRRLLSGSLLLLMLCGCIQSPAPLTITLSPTPADDVITTQNVGQLTILTTLQHSRDTPIAALAFTSDTREMVTAQGNPGMITRWQLANYSMLSEIETQPFGIGAAQFDGRAERLIVAAGDIQPARDAKLNAAVKNWGLYDTKTGEGLHKVPYREGDDGLFGSVLTDITISSNGLWVAEAKEHGYCVFPLDQKYQNKCTSIMWFPESGTPFNYTSITFDPTGDWLFLGKDNGQVSLWQWQIDSSNSWYSTRLNGIPLALVVDPTRTILAVVATDGMSLIPIQHFGFFPLPPYLTIRESSPGPAAGVAFSVDGTLLAIATKDKWQVRSTDDGKLLFEQSPGGYAVAFSPDGRLLAIGGDGAVNIWGISLAQK